MKKFSSLRIWAVIALFALMASVPSSAQIVYTINGGPGSTQGLQPDGFYPNPFSDYYWGHRELHLIKASEMQAAGMPGGQIVSIAAEITNTRGNPPARALNIKIGQTTLTTLTAGTPFPSTLTNVHTNTNWVPSTGVITFTFTQPFQWDGTSNILIETCTQRSAYTYVFPEYRYTTTPGYTSTLMYISDANGVCTNTITPFNAYQQRPQWRIGVLSGISESFPDDVDPRRILRAGEVYGGQDATHPSPSITFRETVGQNVALTYSIIGPLPSTQIIYTATDNGNNSDTIINYTGTASGNKTITFTSAKGIAAGANGALDLTNIPGGAYRVVATYEITGYKQEWMKEFNIAFSNDLSIRDIVAPNTNAPTRFFKYLRGIPVPIAARFQNAGLNTINTFKAIAEIRSGGTGNGSVVYLDTVEYSGALNTGDLVTINFPSFATLNVSEYTLRICGILTEANDQQLSNNCLPGSGVHKFEVQYDTEIQAVDITRPTSGDVVYANRPLLPSGRFMNTGLSVVENMPAQMIIERVSPNPVVVYNQTVNVPDLTPGILVTQSFPLFTPPTAGTYKVCIIAIAEDDPIRTNDTTCSFFNVQESMSGLYTIGTANQGSARNFTTLQDAANALYRRSISGPVTFEFTDANYVAGNAALNAPALDLRSTIIGVSATNTITFKPSQLLSTSRSSVNIALRSGSGIGIILGESFAPLNSNAVFNETKTQENANATGYITFDGGAQKSLRFTLESNAAHRAVFYLGNEANNTTIRNVIIENAPTSTASYASILPKVIFSQSNLQFSYETDVRTPTTGPVQTYSAGIAIRNTPTERFNLQNIPVGQADTNTSNNNRVLGNEISGFGFGVVGIGIGPLYKPQQGAFQRYYMKGLEIRDNAIQNIGRAGIYVANTEDAMITGNRIADVGQTATGVTSVEASGIRTGGENSYNNINMTIARNEISGVTSSIFTRGVAVEQVEQELLTGSGNVFRFPDAGSRNKTMNNMIWGMARINGTANAAGIHYFTQRSTTLTGLNQLLTPQRMLFFTTGDSIAGNTVMMGDLQSGAGVVAGIGVQQAKAAVVYNNAIAMTGGIATSTTAHSALMFEGVMNQTIRTGAAAGTMTANAIMSNYNAFWTPNATIARMIEVDDQSRTVRAGTYTEYTTLTQWRQGTGNDQNSVYGNFTGDYQYTGTGIQQRLRVKTNPTPIGSILNNRGARLANLGTDIDNEVRGAAGQRPDMGGDEFNGRLYVNDVESVEILTPGSYRATTGNVSDAEYIMTKAPVSVTATVRNSGNINQADVPVRLRIYAETALTSQTTPIPTPGAYGPAVIDVVRQVTIPAGEAVTVTFTNLNFTPQTYAQMGMASTAPVQFRTMAQNVTPRYSIETSVNPDENNGNNVTSKEVRFYLMKSPLAMLASVKGSTVDMTMAPTQNMIAGRLNSDSVRAALKGLGWDNNGVNVSTYDLFERNSWEPRAVDYTMYRTLVWAQDQQATTYDERQDLRDYVYSGATGGKKNLALASQEIARKHIGFDPVNDQDFVQQILRTQYVATNSGTPFLPNYDGKKVIGVAIAENTSDFVRSTGFAGDAAPVPALVRVFSSGQTEGLARVAYKYETRNTGVVDSAMGVASTSTGANIVYLGTDWRHFARTTNQSRSGVERVLRGIMDFFERNGGTVVPVELAGDFQGEALRRDNAWTVNLWWKVASEVNVANYEVERAVATENGFTEFTAVGAQTPGKVNYQVEDRSVEAGRVYVYRLRSTDRDGSFSLSNEVEIRTGQERGDMQTAWMNIGPMPVTSNATVKYGTITDGMVEFVIFDSKGSEVMRINGVNTTAGQYETKLDAQTLASGSYTVQMLVNGQNSAIYNLSVVK